MLIKIRIGPPAKGIMLFSRRLVNSITNVVPREPCRLSQKIILLPITMVRHILVSGNAVPPLFQFAFAKTTQQNMRE